MEEVCEVQWSEIAEHGEDVGSCTPATRGKIKDSCKVSCNQPCGGKYIKIYRLKWYERKHQSRI